VLDYLRIVMNARLAKMDERGASAVEYGLLIAGIAALIVVVVFAFGGVIKNIFSDPARVSGRAPPAAPAAAERAHEDAADPPVRGTFSSLRVRGPWECECPMVCVSPRRVRMTHTTVPGSCSQV
jgi:pilus assembly protein Flp/PilA